MEGSVGFHRVVTEILEAGRGTETTGELKPAE